MSIFECVSVLKIKCAEIDFITDKHVAIKMCDNTSSSMQINTYKTIPIINKTLKQRGIGLLNVLLILILLGVAFCSCQKKGFQVAQINETPEKKYPFTVWSPGIKAKMFKDGTYFFFVEFISSDSAYGYMACHAYKGSGFAQSWLFVANKIGPNHYVSETVHYGDYSNKTKIEIYKKDNAWYYQLGSKKPIKLNDILLSPCPDPIRKEIYVTSVINRKRYLIKAPYGKRYLGDGTQNKIFKLPFDEFKKEIDSMTLDELYELMYIHPNQDSD